MKPGGIQTFLIADIRGYTRFTQAQGDEAAAQLAAKFAALTRETVENRGGRLIELRGDEALTVFDSPRLALGAAVDLQAQYLSATEAQPELPLGVGIGIDAGEAVPVEEGYRGGALNLAARLCSLAGPGEILTSSEVTHLARRVPGISYRSKGRAQLKGLPPGTEIVKVFSEVGDPAERFAALKRDQSKAVDQDRRRRLIGLVAGTGILAVTVTVLVLLGIRTPGRASALVADSVGLINPESGEILAEVGVGDRPSAVTYGAGSLWVANSGNGTVSRIDPESQAVIDTVQVGPEVAGIIFGYGQLWVADSSEATVSRIDPKTSTVVQTTDVNSGPTGLAAGLGSVWVANKLDDTVTRLDPDSGKIEKTIDVGDGPSEIAVGFGGVWVTNQFAGTISKIDPKTSSVVDSINVGNGPRGISTGSGALWVANSLDGNLSKVDPETQSITRTIEVGEGPSGVTSSAGVLWVTNETQGTLSKIDATATEVVDTIDVGASPAMTAVTEEGLWVTIRDDGDSHRGGTITIALNQGAIDSIDPGLSYTGNGWGILSVTNDGLVGHKRVGGIEGATIVPNLATSLPQPTDGGRTYTFELRPDVRYSTGEFVQASDVRSSLERTLRFGIVPYFSAIRGASACTPRKCNLSEGIIADDSDGTVTFHLEAPDSEFFYKLALPFASVLPDNSPKLSGGRSVPATGPYMIANYEPGKQLELVRNPHFREWSSAAQPQGYADEIVYRLADKPREQVSKVASGRVDLMDLPPEDEYEEITTEYPEQTVVTADPVTYFMALHTRRPPFNDHRVRRAVNLAVDRAQIVNILGGPDRVRATCQLLPPNFPSYEPYCPYTSDPSADGEWTGPDLERARRLIAASGTKGTKVTVWGIRPDREFVDYIVSLLTDLGYDVNQRLFGDVEQYIETVTDPRTRTQIVDLSWIADYPSPAGFFEPLLTCDSYTPRSHNNYNWGGFCDKHIDSLITRASKLQVSDPAAARDLWTRIDAAIVDRAPYLFLFNPRSTRFLSERVGNFQYSQASLVLYEQLWVR